MDTRTETLKISKYDMKHLKRKGNGDPYKGLKSQLVTSKGHDKSIPDKIERVIDFMKDCTIKSRVVSNTPLSDLYETYCQYEETELLGKILFSKSLKQLGYEVRNANGNEVRVYGVELAIVDYNDIDEDEDW